MKLKSIAYNVLLAIGICNTAALLVGSFIGSNKYSMAEEFGEDMMELMLIGIPITLTAISIIWFLVDTILKPEKQINYLALAFVGILADAVFLISSFIMVTPSTAP